MITQILLKHQLTNKRKLFRFLCFLLLSFLPFSLHAQVTLSPGDVMIVGFNSDSPDGFAIVTFVDLSAGDKIHFTDEGWTGSTFNASTFDNKSTYTVPAGGINAGTVLTSSDMGVTHSLDHNGDQILIYQTADGNSSSSPTFIYGFNNNDFGASGNHGWNTSATTAASSTVPSGLTKVTTDGGTGNAFGLLSLNPSEDDNYHYSGPETSASIADWVTRIHTFANWTRSGGIGGSGYNFDLVLPNTFPLPAAGSPEILIANNANDTEIADESTTINTTLGTDYGSLCHAGTANSSNTYKVSNTGTADLTFSADALSISNTTDFSVTTDITNNSTLAASNDITFTIQFDPQSAGTKTCTVTVNSDDSDEGVYNFAIQGVGNNPTITVAATNSSVSEAGGTALEYTFTRDCTSGQLDVNFSIEGTAEDADYTVGGSGLVSGSYNTVNNTGDVRFADGSSTAVITVTPANDVLIEASETVVVKIDNP